ncbi:MAG TPA: radical SAM protein, partial [Micromonosporaceae bacterium]
MASQLPEGEDVPVDGALPASALESVGERGFGVYVHVPFCASRCGYCDFNTYAPGEGVARDGYVDAVLAEIALAARVLETPPARVDTVFVGGGTPTLLPPSDLGRILDAVDKVWGLAEDAEVTTEANPESVDPRSLRALKNVGFSRISLGMQ